jgi:hypothetical protein
MDELLSKYIDRQGFADDTQFALGELEQLESAFDKLKDIKIGMQGVSGIKDFVSSVSQAAPIIQNLNNTIAAQTSTLKQSTDATKQNVTAQNDLSASAKQLQKEKEKLASLSTDEAKQIAELKVQQTQQNAANKEAAINTLGLRDSYQLLNQEYQNAQKTAKALSAQALINPEFKEQATAAAEKANDLATVLKTIDASVGQFQRNVGNYTGAVGILQKGFAEAKTQLDQLTQAQRENTTSGQQLQKEVEILGNLSAQQTKGFSTLTSELRQSENALRTMYEAGLGGTKTFQELQTSVNNAARDVKNFKEQQALLQSDSPVLAGLTAAARGLGGAYAVGAGAAALFADGNEKVEKELYKLVAIMNVLQGLAEFNKLISEKSAIATALNTVKTSFLAAAESLVAKVTGESTAALDLNTAAQIKNAAAKVAGTVATGAAADADSGLSDVQDKVADGIAAVNTAVLNKNNALIKDVNASEKATKAAIENTTAVNTNAAAVSKDAALTEAAAGAKAELGAAAGASVAPLGEAAAAEQASATASTELAAASAPAAAGMEAQAVGAVALAEGLDTVAASEGAVAAGASTMATAIAATGIGLVIVGLAVAIYEIYKAITNWNNAIDSVEKANKDLVKTIKDLIDATKQYDDIRKLTSQEELADLQKIVDKRKALGVTQSESLALDLKVAELRAKNAADDVKTLGVTKEKVALAQQQALEAANQLRIEQQFKKEFEDNAANKGNPKYDKILEGYNDRIQAYKDDYDARKANLDLGLSALNESADAEAQVENLKNQKIKLSDDDLRKYKLSMVQIESDAQTAANERILNNDRSTLAQRLDALKSNLAGKIKVINAENISTQNDPTVSTTDKLIAAKKAAADIASAQKDSDEAIYKEKEDFRLKDLAAVTAVQKAIYDRISQTNQDIYNNDALTEAQRLEALKKSIEARKQSLEAQYTSDLSSAGISDPDIERIKQEGFFEISNKKITDEELKKLIADFNNAVIDLSKDASLQQIKIVKDYYEQYAFESDKALKKIAEETAASNASLEESYSKQVVDLNEMYKNGEIAAGNYNKEKLKLDDDYAKNSLQIQIENIEKSLAASKSAAEVEIELQKELNDLKGQSVAGLSDSELKVHDDRIKQVTDELKAVQEAVGKESDLYRQLSKLKADLSNQDKKITDDSLNALVDAFNKIKDIGTQVFSVIEGAINGMVTRQKNALQDQSDALDAYSARQIELINASGLAEQEKADKITILNARVQAQKDEIALKQKQADEENARAQKATAIFNIVLATAVAVVKALPNIPLSVLIGALGAAQLAVAIATPVPKYKHGKNLKDNYEGPAIVGDGGVPEYIKREDGTIEKTPSTDTLTYVKKNDVIYPNFFSMMKALAMPVLNVGSVRDNSADQIELALQRQTNILRPLLSSIANKKELSLRSSNVGMEAIWKWGSSQTKYVEENTNW